MNGREPTAADKLEALARQYETLKAAYVTLEAEAARLREALTDLCDAIPDETAKADPPLEVWIAQAWAALEGRPYASLDSAMTALDAPAQEGGEGR